MSFSTRRLRGKIAIVTASTDGIGYSIARRLAQHGAKVIISSRTKKNVDFAVSRLKSENLDVEGVVCHVSKPDQRKELFDTAKRLGGLDILVSNAGVNPSDTHVLDCEESAWDKIFDVNVKCAFLLAKEALPLLREKPYGRIIFVSSVAGYHPYLAREIGAYGVSKTALTGLTKAAALQLAAENITVNCLAPGVIITKFMTKLLEEKQVEEEALKAILIHRFGVPDDICGAAAFLASEEASYITGEVIVIAGGLSARI